MGADPGLGFLGGSPVSGFLILIMLLPLILGSWSRSMRIRERRFPMNLGWTNRGCRRGLLTADHTDGRGYRCRSHFLLPEGEGGPAWSAVALAKAEGPGEGRPPARSDRHVHRAGSPDQAALQEHNHRGFIVVVCLKLRLAPLPGSRILHGTQRRSSQVVRQGSAKPLRVGSIPTSASNL